MRAALLLAPAIAAPAASPRLLARMDLPPTALPSAVEPYAALRDAAGREYVLTFADRDALDAAALPHVVLATNADPSEFVLVCRIGNAPRPNRGEVVMNDGRRMLVRLSETDRVLLAEQGYTMKALPARAPPGLRSLPAGRVTAASFNPVSFDPWIAEIVQGVLTTNLHALVSQWSGVAPALAGGEPCTIATRYTTNQVATLRAALLALQRFEALGLTAQFHHWSASIYSNRNVIATLPGGSLSQEVILVTAHLDSYAPSPRAVAPGADDNASGSAAVVVAADLLRRFRFDRTVRFVLFTGEEQGLYGSQRYASMVSGAGENIVAVFNMDMIAWDSTGGPTLRLHTRTSGSAGYASDRAIAATFTNIVAVYGLSASLTPLITADGESASDHSSFWDVGYPGILAIEDDDDDFHAYYHTTNDVLSRMNLPYFTAFTKASIATVAHLAQPVARTHVDVVQVDSSDWTPGSGIGAGTFHARHEDGALEAGTGDPRDLAWSAARTNPLPRFFRVQSAPSGIPLATDARPTNSETVFQGQLLAFTTGTTAFASTNRLRFGQLALLESNRAYTLRVQLDPRYTDGSNAFQCVTNLRSILATGGFLPLPLLTNLTNGTVYGTLDIASRLQVRDATAWPLEIEAGATGFAFRVPAQIGFPVIDVLEWSTNLLGAAAWRTDAAFTSDVPPTAGNFDSGWDRLRRAGGAPADAAHYRIRRQWVAP